MIVRQKNTNENASKVPWSDQKNSPPKKNHKNVHVNIIDISAEVHSPSVYY